VGLVRIRSSSVRALDALPAFSLQDRLLPGVSRTFALTIPQLPGRLRAVVTNAYLLCRTADTIEDEVSLSPDEKQEFHDRFIAVVADRAGAEAFARDLAPRLSDVSLPAERELVRETAAVVSVTHSFTDRERAAIERCIRIMCDGMPRFARQASLNGLADVPELDEYCYHVAGVVGEMLTELFCAHAPEVEARRSTLEQWSTSFGQGLQMVNIIKDTWADRARGACWLPRDVFRRHGLVMATMQGGQSPEAMAAAYDELIALAHGHLHNALAYTLAIPASEPGIRRFNLWALGLAVLSLKKVYHNPDFLGGQSVKVSRNTVKATVAVTSLAVKHDRVLRQLMAWASAGLPVTMPLTIPRARPVTSDPGTPVAVSVS
jgi:farnesyl-diphosphate farnesyltransferase